MWSPDFCLFPKRRSQYCSQLLLSVDLSGLPEMRVVTKSQTMTVYIQKPFFREGELGWNPIFPSQKTSLTESFNA